MVLASVLEWSSVMTKAMEMNFKATVNFLKPDAFCYLTYPFQVNDKECKKKCVQEYGNEWFCPRCKVQIPKCNYYYLL